VGMTKMIEATEPVTQAALRERVRDEVSATDPGYDGITADPFGDTSTQAAHRNVMMGNSSVWPDVTLWDEEVAGNAKPAQHFHRARTVEEVVQVAAYLADAVITAHNLTDDVTAHFVTDKIAEGFAYRVGVVETVVEIALEAELGWEVAPRSLTEVASDEQDGIDIRANDALYNVKFESANATGKNIKRIDVSENDGTLEIEIE